MTFYIFELCVLLSFWNSWISCKIISVFARQVGGMSASCCLQHCQHIAGPPVLIHLLRHVLLSFPLVSIFPAFSVFNIKQVLNLSLQDMFLFLIGGGVSMRPSWERAEQETPIVCFHSSYMSCSRLPPGGAWLSRNTVRVRETLLSRHSNKYITHSNKYITSTLVLYERRSRDIDR